MKYSFATIPFVLVASLGIFGVFSSVSAQNTEVQVDCDTGGTVAAEVESLDFGSVEAVQVAGGGALLTGAWEDTIDGVEGIKITDEKGVCGSTGGSLWTLSWSFSNMAGINNPSNVLVNNAIAGFQSDFVDGSGDILFPITLNGGAGAANADSLTLISGQDTPNLVVNSYHVVFNYVPSTSQQLAVRNYAADDGAVGVWELKPELQLFVGAFIPADRYQGTISISIG